MSVHETEREAVRHDFDRLAQCAPSIWNHNIHYYPLLLRALPPRMERVLDVGCGIGDLARLLAERALRVEGIDFSPGMITRARQLTPPDRFPRVHYHCADIMETALDPGGYDAIVSVAAAHHLPLGDYLARCRAALKPGGTVAILDLYEPATCTDHLLNVLAVPAGQLLRAVRCAGQRADPRETALWNEHAPHDHYLTIRDIASTAQAVFPGCSVRRLLLWRYFLLLTA